MVDSLGEVEGRSEIHRHTHGLVESKKVSLDGEPGFREGLYEVYSPRIWAELMKLTALGFVKMKIKRGERGYVYTFKLTRGGRRVVESLRKRYLGITITRASGKTLKRNKYLSIDMTRRRF